MKKQITTLALSLASLFVIAAPALSAETWTCNYKGDWATSSSGNKGNFTWVVYWVKKGAGDWSVLGNYTDRYGFSWLDGNCSSKNCTFNQTYKQGQLKGKTYVWKGSYSDKSLGKGKTLNTISGYWGTKSQPKQGPWSAKATCSVNPPGFDVQKALEK